MSEFMVFIGLVALGIVGGYYMGYHEGYLTREIEESERAAKRS